MLRRDPALTFTVVAYVVAVAAMWWLDHEHGRVMLDFIPHLIEGAP